MKRLARHAAIIWLALAACAEAQYLRSGGESSSSEPGTTLAEIVADPGHELVNILAIGAHRSSSGNGHRLIVTYDSDPPLTRTPTTGGARMVVFNDAGVIELLLGRHIGITARDSGRRVVGVRLETNGSGASVKGGVISALQVPIGSGPAMKYASGSTSSASGSAFVSITADPGKVLTRWSALAAHSDTASVSVTLRVTYTDDTTASLETTPGGNGHIIANPAGMIATADYGYTNHVFLSETLGVKKIEAIPSGSASGTRSAILSAVQADSDANRLVASGAGTSATTLLDKSASPGRRLVAMSCFAAQTNLTGNTMTMHLHDDSGSTSQATDAGTRGLYANLGGTLLTTQANVTAAPSGDLKRVRLITAGSGATRAVILSAIDEPLSSAAVKHDLMRRRR